MLMLMCIRKALYVMMRSHTADYSLGPICGREMQNMTVGIIGTGRIGKAVIKNLSGFGCKIIAYDPYPAKGLENVEYVTLDELYARADIISLHTFLSDETYHMINKDSIAKMKDGVILINAARGALVDTKDLIEAVERVARLVQLELTAVRVRMNLSVQTVSMMTLLLITITSYLSLSRILLSHLMLHFSQIRLCLIWLSLQLRVLCSLQPVKTHH